MPARIGNAEFESEVLRSPLPVLADFYSDSCIPCRRISPVLSQLENEYSGKAKIVRVNAVFEAELAEKYGILATPTLILFKDGKEVSRIRGAAQKDEITHLIDQVL